MVKTVKRDTWIAAVVIGIVGFILVNGCRQAAPPQPFTIAKAWWPAWDTFQIRVQQCLSLQDLVFPGAVQVFFKD